MYFKGGWPWDDNWGGLVGLTSGGGGGHKKIIVPRYDLMTFYLFGVFFFFFGGGGVSFVSYYESFNWRFSFCVFHGFFSLFVTSSRYFNLLLLCIWHPLVNFIYYIVYLATLCLFIIFNIYILIFIDVIFVYSFFRRGRERAENLEIRYGKIYVAW